MSNEKIAVLFHGDHWFGHWSLGLFFTIIVFLLVVMLLKSYKENKNNEE